MSSSGVSLYPRHFKTKEEIRFARTALKPQDAERLRASLDARSHPLNNIKLVYVRALRRFELHLPVPAVAEWARPAQSQDDVDEGQSDEDEEKDDPRGLICARFCSRIS